MPSEKRQRQDEGRLLRLEAERAAAQKARHRSLARTLGLLLMAVLVVSGAIALLSGDGGDSSADSTTTTTAAAGQPVDIALPAPGASVTGETPCPAADGSAERTTSFEQAPPTCVDAAKTYTATLSTSEGDIVIDLDIDRAPINVNNFVVLARYHFYDGVAFHRIIPGFMDQTGDPVGPSPGQGDPGYTVPDELPTGDAPYPTGTVAMANSSAPDTGGSQFFITVEGGGDQLTPSYTAFGHVTQGQDVVDAINQYGDAATNGTPITKVVTIDAVTITES